LIVDPDGTVRSRFMDHAAAQRQARTRRRRVPEPLDEPLGVIASDELADDAPRLGQALEAMEIEALLLERAHEAHHSVAFGLADVGRCDRHS
jgi:hypothetical protein